MKTYQALRRSSGRKYRLFEKEEGMFWISCNDGVVPSGQLVNGPLERILQDFDMELIPE